MIYIQLIGVLAFCILVLSFYRKTITEILVFQTTASFIYTVHYLLLGALTGAYVCVISIIRNIVLLKFNVNKKVLCIILFAIYAIIAYLFYEGLYSLMPMAANSIYLIYLVKDDKKKLLEGQVICSLIWALYGVFVLSYSEIITQTILVLSTLIQLRKMRKVKDYA